jgi:glycogen debranching enzyme
VNGQIATQERADDVPGQSGITHALVLKDRDLFFLSNPDGCVPIANSEGLGLYYHDCRFLNGYELKIAGQKPDVLESNAERGDKLTLKARTTGEHRIDVHWSRVISNKDLALRDTITLENLTTEQARFPLGLAFQSDFEDLFAVRGFRQRKRGTLLTPEWTNGVLHFCYQGADSIFRQLEVHFSPLPYAKAGASAHFQVDLAPDDRKQFLILLRVSESPERKIAKRFSGLTNGYGSDTTLFRDDDFPSYARVTRVISDNPDFDGVLDRSLRDLDMLRTNLGTNSYFAAGVPWYVALFGRDSIITALQMLAYDAQTAEQTIRLLAHYQGKEVNEWRDEVPGKILHELRVGEMAHLAEIPHTPYYGTIDATPLWLVLIGRHAAWTGDLHIFNELRPNIEAALNWIDQYGDFNRDGYVEYECKSEGGLLNQGWKDSADAIVNQDGSLGEAPIALVEVQGYVFRAKVEMAALFRRTGDDKRARILADEAQRLRERFNRDFWLEAGYYALALQKGHRRVAVLSSNAGHALWSGIANLDQARQTAQHLLSPEMFTGWGIRTLSRNAVKYDPLAYHLGTVWPHDNSLIAAGLKNYGMNQETLQILSGMLDAAQHFEGNRLPELFGGLARENDNAPAPYPIACQPQAWAAATIPYLLTSILGLEPHAFERRLKIVRPMLPENVHSLEIHNLRVGGALADLIFERGDHGVTARILQKRGPLEVMGDAMV